MFEKIKRYIHKIKRHRRNKRLSKFADAFISETPDRILADYVESCLKNLCGTISKDIA